MGLGLGLWLGLWLGCGPRPEEPKPRVVEVGPLDLALLGRSAGHVEMRDLPPTQRAALRAQRLAHRLLREG